MILKHIALYDVVPLPVKNTQRVYQKKRFSCTLFVAEEVEIEEISRFSGICFLIPADTKLTMYKREAWQDCNNIFAINSGTAVGMCLGGYYRTIEHTRVHPALIAVS